MKNTHLCPFDFDEYAVADDLYQLIVRLIVSPVTFPVFDDLFDSRTTEHKDEGEEGRVSTCW